MVRNGVLLAIIFVLGFGVAIAAALLFGWVG